jgi:hypothetical protein
MPYTPPRSVPDVKPIASALLEVLEDRGYAAPPPIEPRPLVTIEPTPFWKRLRSWVLR